MIIKIKELIKKYKELIVYIIFGGLTTVVEENKTYAEGRYARVCIGTFEGTPKTGDILITL